MSSQASLSFDSSMEDQSPRGSANNSGSSNCSLDELRPNTEFEAKFERGGFGTKNIQDHFIYLGHEPETAVGAKRKKSNFWGECRQCGKKIKSNGSSGFNLERHATETHKLILRVKGAPQGVTVSLTAEVPPPKKVAKVDLKSPEQVSFGSLLMYTLIAECGLPFEFLQKRAFHTLFGRVAPHLTVPTPGSLKEELDTAMQAIPSKIKALVNRTQVDFAHLILERWGDDVTKIIIWTIDSDFKLNTFGLGFHLLNELDLKKMLKDAGIDEVSCVMVGDIQKGIRGLNLDSSFPESPWFITIDESLLGMGLSDGLDGVGKVVTNCASSTFATVLDRALANSDEDTANLIGKLNSWAVFIHRNPEITKDLKLPNGSCLPEQRFRLDSIFWIVKCLKEPAFTTMLKRIILQAQADDLPVGDITTAGLDDENVKKVAEIASLLGHFELAIANLQQEGPICHFVVGHITRVFYKIAETEVHHMGSLKKSILSEMSQEFSSWLLTPELMVTTVLNPRVKMSQYVGIYDQLFSEYEFALPKRDLVFKELVQLLRHDQPDDEVCSNVNFNPNPFLGLKVQNNEENPNSLDDELKTYLKEAIVVQGLENPLDYWRIRKHSFPRLASAAKKYFALPVSVKTKEACLTAERYQTLRGNHSANMVCKLLTLSEFNRVE